MAECPNKKADNMVYSPDYHVPIGQAIKHENGEYYLRVKKDKLTFEDISISKLLSEIIQIADKKNKSRILK